MCVFTEREAAAYVGVSTSFLRQSRSRGNRPNTIDGPPWLKYGRAVRYDLDDLNAWKLMHRVCPSATLETSGSQHAAAVVEGHGVKGTPHGPARGPQ